jgi:hypothetical protein
MDDYQKLYESVHGKLSPDQPDSNSPTNEMNGIGASSDTDVRMHLFPPEVIRLQMEIAFNHPKLKKILDESARDGSYDPENFFGNVFAYCGVQLDGSYTHDYLVEEAYKCLVNKHNKNAIMGTSTMPSMQQLTDVLIQQKEAWQAAQVPSTEISLDIKLN